MNKQSVYFLLIVFLFHAFLSFSQIEVKTIYTDNYPNNNCYFAVQNQKIGLTNRDGVIYIDEDFKGKKVIIHDIETDLKYEFTVNEDTIIVTERIQELDEVSIKPRNRKKLLEAIIELNQERLKKQLTLKGEIFIAEHYVLSNAKTNASDTIIEVFSCDVIITRVANNLELYISEGEKLRIGEIRNPEIYELQKSLFSPFKNFNEVLNNKLNYESYEMKKFRKYNSIMINDLNKRHLVYTNTESPKLFYNQKGEEHKYSWRKSDSSLLKVAKYFSLNDSNTKKSIVFPYNNNSFIKRNSNFENSILTHEQEFIFRESNSEKTALKNIFYYILIDKSLHEKPDLKSYKKVNDFQELYFNKKAKNVKKLPDPKIYPLRFPVTVFF